MGAVGALIAAAASDSRCAAVVSVAAPADPRLLTRQTFRLARLPIPSPVAQPLAWLTARVYVRPRGHSVRDISARHAAARYDGPILLVHGDRDAIIPLDHLERLEAAALVGRATGPATAQVERPSWPGAAQLAVRGRGVSSGRRRFLATWLGGPYDPTAPPSWPPL
jgi:pimeloyl-ACP methyl ester carboxylesterase